MDTPQAIPEGSERCKRCRQEFFVGKGAHHFCNECLGVNEEMREARIKEQSCDLPRVAEANAQAQP